MPHMGNWYGLGLAGLILNVILWGAFIVGIAYLLNRVFRGAGGYPPRDNALDILKNRYAAGEITEEDFDRMKDKIK